MKVSTGCDLRGPVSTFDVFDTVLTRRTALPVDIFMLLGAKLREEGVRVPSAGMFRALRVRAERWSRRMEPGGEVTLEDIHRMLGRLLGWSEEDRRRSVSLELSLEEEFLTATPHGRAAVNAARNEGRRVAFVSDMYLAPSFIRRILERENLILPGDLLAVSGEWKVTKGRGDMWPRLLAELEAAPHEILHRGDNRHGDVVSPGRAGLKAERLGTAEASRWEDWSRYHGPEDIRRFGGIAALCRTARAGMEEPDEFWTSLGAGVLGPLLAGFAFWILEQARRDAVRTIWFLSRDGLLPLEAARIFADADSPKLEYLCAGRRQLQLALSAETATGDLFEGSRLASLQLLGSRFALDERALHDLREEAGLPATGLLERLNAAARSRITEILAGPAWQARIAAARHQAGEPVRQYLGQMADQAAGRVAVADVGWRGSSQDLLNRLLPANAPLWGYYLGLTGSGPTPEHKAAWLYNRPEGEGDLALDRHQRLFEVLLGGAAGPLQGYERNSGKWEPVFAMAEAGEHAPGRERAQKAALAFVRLAADPLYRSWWTLEDLHGITTRNLLRLFEHPDATDALHFADWTVTTDEAHADSVALAKGYDVARIRTCLFQGEPWAWLWPAASLRNSSFIGGWLMRLAALLRGA
ncbi:hypothetical protein KBB96_15290 [Luteolibacter ambystomatis]|uniref:HAD family hydrolase n=1 Tax=Luteolibacter ambystomatis TaxID=2824561 RepID=A0A975G7H8_9BACT|nr:hypothetical protein [Luteolibacter ambystomatis]QUE50228.1 hypothetical protein KBB96_15290 [Luteolibacter ambystomatis]